MKRKAFFKDKYRHISSIISKLAKYEGVVSSSSVKKRYTDKDVINLRKLSNKLQIQIHELNAGRNIFLDNDKDM